MYSIPLGKMKDVKHIESPESIPIAVWNGFKPEQMLKATKKMLKEMGEEKPDNLLKSIYRTSSMPMSLLLTA